MIHFVSQGQYLWHDIRKSTPYVVIPNVVVPLEKSPLGTKTAGVIGSIDRFKQTHLSIERALGKVYNKILLYGNVTDREYFEKEVSPYVSKGVAILMGHVDDRQKMYDSVDEVFHSSVMETYNFIRAECHYTGVKYDGLESANTDAELWTSDKIFEKWNEVFNG